MSKAAKLFRSGALFVLSALGLSAYATKDVKAESAGKDVKAESAGKADVGSKESVLPRYPGAQMPGAQMKNKMGDSLFGGNRAWRVDKNKNAPKAPSAKKDRSTE